MIQGILSHNSNAIEAIRRRPTFNLKNQLEQARIEQAEADALLAALEDELSTLYTTQFCGIWTDSNAIALERLEKARLVADRFHRIVRTLERMEGSSIDMTFSTKQGEEL